MVEIVLTSSACTPVRTATTVEFILFWDDDLVNDDGEANLTVFTSSTVLLVRDGLRDKFDSSTLVPFIKSLTNSSKSSRDK
jgi:hypothetical protein